MGWPEKTEMFDRYYPTNVLVTGYDIIFFWVSRMLFEGIEFTKHAPFKEILIHGLVRDSKGRKMSKSLGNGIDPFDVIDKYGCDALRYFLNTNSAPGLDLRYEEEKVASSWNFLNKLWNISRYVMMNIEGYSEIDLKTANLNLASKWILNKLNKTIKTVDYNYDKYEFGEANKALYNFIWEDFANWYVEVSKVDLQDTNLVNKNTTQNVLVYVLTSIVKMLHPVAPFITEEIYQTLPHTEESISISQWPTIAPEFNFEEAEEGFNSVIEIITSVRNERAKANKAPKEAINVTLVCKSLETLSCFNEAKPYFTRFLNPKELVITKENIDSKGYVVVVLEKATVYIPQNELIDFEKVVADLNKEKARLENELERSKKMLSNPNFVSKAPEAKLNQEKEKLAKYEAQYKEVLEHLANIK